jgi:hypothetical protein
MLVKGQAPKGLIVAKAGAGCRQSRGERAIRLRLPLRVESYDPAGGKPDLFPAVAMALPLTLPALKDGASRGGTDDSKIFLSPVYNHDH